MSKSKLLVITGLFLSLLLVVAIQPKITLELDKEKIKNEFVQIAAFVLSSSQSSANDVLAAEQSGASSGVTQRTQVLTPTPAITPTPVPTIIPPTPTQATPPSTSTRSGLSSPEGPRGKCEVAQGAYLSSTTSTDLGGSSNAFR